MDFERIEYDWPTPDAPFSDVVFVDEVFTGADGEPVILASDVAWVIDSRRWSAEQAEKILGR